MSEPRDREAAGAPVEESATSESDVRAAVERANSQSPVAEDDGAAENAADSAEAASGSADELSDDTVATKTGGRYGATQAHADDATREADFAQSAADDGTSATALNADHAATTAFAAQEADAIIAERSEEAKRPTIAESDDLPSAGADARERSAAVNTEPYDPVADERAAQDAVEKARRAERPETIQIEKDHPMAALYMQAPMPPELAGNRGAGILISLLATVAFALIYAGVISLGLMRHFAPSTFLEDGLLPHVMSYGYIGATVGFFLGMVILVLLVGRSGWWAYVLGGFWVAVFVAAVATVGYGYSPQITGLNFGWGIAPIAAVATIPQVLAAAVVAREVSVWFGAWIGARGRRMTARNREAIAEYEEAVAESKKKSPSGVEAQ
jgi:hypothetical protein